MYPDQSDLTCLISFGVLSFFVASIIFSKACNSSITISGSILDPYSVRALLLFAILCPTNDHYDALRVLRDYDIIVGLVYLQMTKYGPNG